MMGLDGVELVMEVEDRFGVKLADSECSRVRTVADLAALVISKLPRSAGPCPTARAFFGFRALMVTRAGVERRRVRARARLDELIGQRRRWIWRELRRHERRLPRLVATSGEDRALLWVGGVLALGWLMGSGVVWGVRGAGFAIPAGAAALGIGLVAFASIEWLFRRHFPPGLKTVGDVARVLAPIEVPEEGPGERLVVEQRVLEEVRCITARTLGIPLERVRASSDFVKDLEVD
jgi:hypothetical protein